MTNVQPGSRQEHLTIELRTLVLLVLAGLLGWGVWQYPEITTPVAMTLAIYAALDRLTQDSRPI